MYVLNKKTSCAQVLERRKRWAGGKGEKNERAWRRDKGSGGRNFEFARKKQTGHNQETREDERRGVAQGGIERNCEAR